MIFISVLWLIGGCTARQSKLVEEDVGKIMERARQIKSQHGKREYEILQELHALLQPGLRREQVHAILGPPNAPGLKGRRFRLVSDVEAYHFHNYNAYLAYDNDVLVENIEDLIRVAGSKYDSNAPYRLQALNRLKELGRCEEYAKFLEWSGDYMDMPIWTVRVLGRIDDPKTTPLLVDGLEKNNFLVQGSESATIHRRLKKILIKTLEEKTGLNLWDKTRFDREEYIADVVGRCRKWLEAKQATAGDTLKR